MTGLFLRQTPEMRLEELMEELKKLDNYKMLDAALRARMTSEEDLEKFRGVLRAKKRI